MQSTQKESSLVRKSRKLFREPDRRTSVLQNLDFVFVEEPKVVQTYTMYSLGDAPIVDFNPPQQ
jgi:hypothetical protein